MKKSNYLLFVFVLFFAACKNDPPADQTTQPPAASEVAVDASSIKLICQKAEVPNDQADAPRHEVFIQMGNSKTKIADILACDVIEKSLYEQYQIPENAITAAGGWWAGGGDYIYVIEEDGNYVVKQGSMDEGREDNDYMYKAVATFSKDGKPLL